MGGDGERYGMRLAMLHVVESYHHWLVSIITWLSHTDVNDIIALVQMKLAS